MVVRSLIDEVDDVDYTITVVGDGSDPFETLLVDSLAGGPIDVASDPVDADATGFATEAGTAVLLADGVPVATSPLEELYESVLAVNSDLFVTGSRGLGEIDLPDVLAGLSDSRLRLRGYPLADNEKLLLIVLSRYIEQFAWEDGEGTLRSAFQGLSRLDDEHGTREVYSRLADTDVDVHVYGVADGTTADLEATVHAGSDRVYRNSWFVVYRPSSPGNGAALVCFETDARVWEGFVTFDADRVASVEERIAAALG
ncbi:DICT sensory domain-containing protein [Natronococcus roseus]|uniref:DICT sensory domain-containing protein n=1 Tax=Natronococcus roseus TaxID=1052014 RepID=UPI00374D9A07